ncbi:MAG: hypothetical protein ACRD72_02600, partial [Candidatus Angelobacter sp.]
MAEEPIGVHDQLYKRLAVERWEEIAVLGTKNISLSLELKHRGGGRNLHRGCFFCGNLDDLINS